MYDFGGVKKNDPLFVQFKNGISEFGRYLSHTDRGFVWEWDMDYMKMRTEVDYENILCLGYPTEDQLGYFRAQREMIRNKREDQEAAN
jgi:hypothetical protein